MNHSKIIKIDGGYIEPLHPEGLSYVVKSQEKAFKFCPFLN